MKTLRSLHLYLGCLFAPMLAFFAISGIWQGYFAHWPKPESTPSVIAVLSTIHTGRSLKVAGDGPSTLSSPWMHAFVVAMALALLFTMALGVVMAFRFGRRKSALWCLVAGIAVPLAFVVLALQA